MSEQTEKQKKRRNQLFFALLVMGVGAVFCCQVALWLAPDTDTASRPRATTLPQTVTVEYRITGTGNQVSLTYENASGNTEQKTVGIPWTQQYTDVPRGQFVHLSAQSRDDGSRTIGCEILVNGTVIEQAESVGEYVIASCSGRAE